MNLAYLSRFWAKWKPEIIAVTCDNDNLSWSELETRTDALARGMLQQGVNKGDVVAVLMTNSVTYLEIALAAIKVGAICAPLNLRLTPNELTHQLENSGAVCVFSESGLIDRLQSSAEKLNQLRVVSVDDGAEDSLESFRVDGSPFPIVDCDDDDGVFLAYTSGTTGLPKGALLTHGGVRISAVTRNLVYGHTNSEKLLCVAQLGAGGTMVATWASTCVVGGASIVLEQQFDPERSLSMIEHDRITTMFAVPIFYERMSQEPAFENSNLLAFRHAVTGGASVSLDLLRRYHARGVPMVQGYGLTETSASGVCLRDEESETRIGSAGIPVFNAALKIIGATGEELPPGEPGEILIRHPGVMKEYFRSPELTAEALRDGWLHTGDIGLLDSEGYLYVIDRKKDMLISGGFNVYPAEIERALAGNKGYDFAVIGIPDSRWGEVPLLLVETQEDSIDIGRISIICETELADFKRPRWAVRIEGPFPRNSLGKIAKNELRARYRTLPDDAQQLSRGVAMNSEVNDD